MRAQRGGASGGSMMSPVSPLPGGSPLGAKPRESAFTAALASQSFSPSSSGDVASPPATPAGALKSPAAAAAVPRIDSSEGAPPKAVRAGCVGEASGLRSSTQPAELCA